LNVGDFTIDMSNAQGTFPNGIANFAITLASVFSFDGSVSMSCGPMPAGLSCPSPWFVNPAPGGAPVTLQLPMQNNAPGNYTITVTGTSSPVSHSASATLQVWDFNGSISPLSATVKAGTSANFNVTIVSVNGFSGQVNFGCQPSTQLISCSFNPSTPTIPANGSVTSVLTLTASSQLKPVAVYRRPSPMILGLSLLFLIGVLFVRTGHSNWKRVYGACLVGTLAFMVSCGGGSSGGGPPPPPPPSTYSVVIQVSSGNYGKDAGTIKLTVD
jgi:hypothetical protein